MKVAAQSIIGLVLAFSFVALSIHSVLADVNSANETGLDNSTAGGKARVDRRSGKPIHIIPAPAAPDVIHGLCEIVQSASNPIQVPCVDLLLLLSDSSGNEVGRVRTSDRGEFELSAKKGIRYRLKPGSQTYVIIAPTQEIHAGDQVELKLQQN